MDIWLIGAGPHAEEHAKVLIAQGCDFLVIGRGEKSAKKFKEKLNVDVFVGGVDKALNELKKPDKAIVSVSFEELTPVCLSLIKSGIKSILLEKPGGLSFQEVYSINQNAESEGASVFVAYSRRYYTSVIEAKRLINNEGGATNLHFEFTEWPETIEPLGLPGEVLEKWVIANSSHVIDLAFYLTGRPIEIKSYAQGGIDWHKTTSFVGCGVTDNGVSFTYNSNWDAPGRWSVEVSTLKNRYIFKPLEKLHVTPKGSVSVNLIDIDYSKDEMYKPGLYLQTEAFLNNNVSVLCTIREQLNNISLYEKIAGYRK